MRLEGAVGVSLEKTSQKDVPEREGAAWALAQELKSFILQTVVALNIPVRHGLLYNKLPIQTSLEQVCL